MVLQETFHLKQLQQMEKIRSKLQCADLCVYNLIYLILGVVFFGVN